MNDTYECSYVEILEILKHIPKEEYDKIPKEKLEFYRKNMDKNYKYTYNIDSPQTSRKTDAIIINLYKDYIATEEEKEKIEEILKLNTKKAERKKKKLYNPDSIFNKKEKKPDIQVIESITEESWYKKIYNYIKKLFRKQRC